MYPRLSDLLYGVFGINLKIPSQTFGFFVALAFLSAYFIIRWELRRREKLGHYSLQKVQIVQSGPLPFIEFFLPTLIWAFVAWKVGYAFIDYDEFFSNTQGVVMSGKGSWVTGIGALLGYGIPRFLQWKKSQREPLVTQEQLVGPSWYMNLVLTMAFFAGLLGAKIATYLENMPAFWADPMGAIFSFNGLTWYGGLLLAAFVICYFFYKRGYEVLNVVDGFAPGLLVGYGMGRLGCHFSGDGDWGAPNLNARPGFLNWLPDWAWAYDYPHNVAQEGIPIPGCTGEFCRHLAQPAWPTPLYEALLAFLIFGALLLLRNKLKYPGQMTAVYMIVIAVERILIETIRVNTHYSFLGIQFTQAQAISAALIVCGAILFWWITFRKKPKWPGVFPENNQSPPEGNLPVTRENIS